MKRNETGTAVFPRAPAAGRGPRPWPRRVCSLVFLSCVAQAGCNDGSRNDTSNGTGDTDDTDDTDAGGSTSRPEPASPAPTQPSISTPTASTPSAGTADAGDASPPVNQEPAAPTPSSSPSAALLPVCDRLRNELIAPGGVLIQVEPGADGEVVSAGQTTTLRAVIQQAAAGSTIQLAPGTYTLAEANDGDYTGLYFTAENVSLRGATGDPTDVVIDAAYRDLGGQTAAISIDAPGVALVDLTVTRAIFHLVHLWANADDAVLLNVHLSDGGQQFLKASPAEGSVDGARVSCSRFTLSPDGRKNVWGYGATDGNTTCYTGGIDTHDARDWTVDYNHFEGIYCDTEPGRPAHGKKEQDRDGQSYAGGLAEHAIHMWNSPEGSAHAINANTIVDCARGIGIGLVDPVYGTRVTNNVVFSEFAASREHDVGISIERGNGIDVSHNTVYYADPDGYPNAIEIRFDSTRDVSVRNNLSNRLVRERDGAVFSSSGNVTDAEDALFVDGAAADLHLESCSAAPTIERLPDVTHDVDGEPRMDITPVGADECAP